MTLPAFLILFPVVGLSLLLIATRQTAVTFAPLVACGVLSVMLFLLGLLDWLEFGSHLLFWVTTLCGLPALYWLRQRQELPAAVLSPTLCALVGLTALHWLLFQNAEYFKWDEFSHWGRAVRDMLGHGALYGPEGNVQFLNYPPAMPLWNYFGAINTAYSEGNTYTFQFVLLLACILPLLNGLAWRRWPYVVAVLAAGLFLLNVLGHGWTSLYVDHVVAAIFLGAILMLIAGTGPNVLWIAPCLMMLALTKDVGLFFAICAGLFWAVRSLLVDRRAAQFGIAALLVAAPVVASVSWSTYVHSRNPTEEQRALEIGDAFAQVASGISEGREAVPGRFASVFFSQETGSSEMMMQYNEFSFPLMPEYGDNLRPSAFGWIVFAMALFGIAWWQQPAARSAVQRIGGFMLTVTAVYFLMLVALYLYVFPERAGNALVSYVRYANIGLVPLIGVAFALLLPGFGRPQRRWEWMPLAIAPLLFLLSPPDPGSWYSKPWRQELRAQMAPLITHMRSNMSADGSIYLHVPREQQFIEMLAVHDLTPQRANVDRTPYRAGDEAALAASVEGNAFAWFPVIDQSIGGAILPLIPQTYLGGQIGGVFRISEGTDGLQLVPVSFGQEQP